MRKHTLPSSQKLRADLHSSTENHSNKKLHAKENLPKKNDLKGTVADASNIRKLDKHLHEKVCLENVSSATETESQSEGDTSSSGGREIQMIMNGKSQYEAKHEKTKG